MEAQYTDLPGQPDQVLLAGAHVIVPIEWRRARFVVAENIPISIQQKRDGSVSAFTLRLRMGVAALGLSVVGIGLLGVTIVASVFVGSLFLSASFPPDQWGLGIQLSAVAGCSLFTLAMFIELR
jgi:hypothetical protein